jgi:cystathionine beta-lyase family protein involved in aluminum resistance
MALGAAVDASTRLLLAAIRGYDWRPSLTLDEIRNAAAMVHEKNPNALGDGGQLSTRIHP